MRRRSLAQAACLLLLATTLCSCLSSEPRNLVPSITLSPETVSLSNGEPIGAGLNLGMSTALNESDSLSNIAVLPGVRVRTVTPNGAAALAGLPAGVDEWGLKVGGKGSGISHQPSVVGCRLSAGGRRQAAGGRRGIVVTWSCARGGWSVAQFGRALRVLTASCLTVRRGRRPCGGRTRPASLTRCDG